jgi:hypothetical protein
VISLAWTSSPTNSKEFFMVCLLSESGFFIGDAAPAVIPHLRQGTDLSAQPAPAPLLQAHRFSFQNTLRSHGGQS